MYKKSVKCTEKDIRRLSSESALLHIHMVSMPFAESVDQPLTLAEDELNVLNLEEKSTSLAS
jgi:hypothetical protein